MPVLPLSYLALAKMSLAIEYFINTQSGYKILIQILKKVANMENVLILETKQKLGKFVNTLRVVDKYKYRYDLIYPPYFYNIKYHLCAISYDFGNLNVFLDIANIYADKYFDKYYLVCRNSKFMLEIKDDFKSSDAPTEIILDEKGNEVITQWTNYPTYGKKNYDRKSDGPAYKCINGVYSNDFYQSFIEYPYKFKLEFYAVDNCIFNQYGGPALKYEICTLSDEPVNTAAFYVSSKSQVSKIVSDEYTIYVKKNCKILLGEPTRYRGGLNIVFDDKIKYKPIDITKQDLYIRKDNIWIKYACNKILYVIEFIPGTRIGILHSDTYPKKYDVEGVQHTTIPIYEHRSFLFDGINLSAFTSAEIRTLEYWFGHIFQSLFDENYPPWSERRWKELALKSKHNKAVVVFMISKGIKFPVV